MKGKLLFVVASLLLLLGGCTHVLSRDALLNVDPAVDYAEVKANPDAYNGKTLLLGGLIIDTRLSREGTTLEVLRFTLDRWGEPQTVDEAGGRFYARTARFLDPELYKEGLFVTLTGTVEGVETRPLQNYEYSYPVFRIVEAYLWNRRIAAYPYGYYDPFYPWGPYPYYPYYYYRDPFWYDPFWAYPYRPWPGRWIR